MSALQNKIDFAVVLRVKRANPNGDPLNGNRPRTDYGGFGEITDVCLKRKLRDRLLESGQAIFVQSDDRKVDGETSLRNRAESATNGLGKDAFKKNANKDATAKWGYSLFSHDVYVSQSMPDMAAGKRAVLYLDPTGLAVKVAENPSVQVLREKFADEHAVGVICWMEVDSKVENKQKIAVLDMKAAVSPGG